MEHSFKQTVFHRCELPYEVFHVQRRTKLAIKQQLARLGYLTLRDGQVELKGQNKPDFKILNDLLPEWEGRFELGSAFSKPDYFLPFEMAIGLNSAEQLQTKGIQIHSLNSRLIYPLWGVWSPTTQEHLNLLSNYVSQSKARYQGYESLVDLGCGTGVMSIVVAENGGYQGKIYSVDSQTRALEAT